MSLCRVLSGSLGTPLSSSKGCHSPQGEIKEQAGCFIWHSRLLSKTRQTWLSTTSLLGLTSSSRIKPAVTNPWLWLQIFLWPEHCSKPPPTVCLFVMSSLLAVEAALSAWGHVLGNLSWLISDVVWQSFLILLCVFPSPVVSAHSGCSWRPIQNTQRAGTLQAHSHRLGCACALLPHQWGLSDSPCPGNNDPQPPATIPRLHRAQTRGLPVHTAPASSISWHYSPTPLHFKEMCQNFTQQHMHRQLCVHAGTRRTIALCWGFTVLPTTTRAMHCRNWWDCLHTCLFAAQIKVLKEMCPRVYLWPWKLCKLHAFATSSLTQAAIMHGLGTDSKIKLLEFSYKDCHRLIQRQFQIRQANPCPNFPSNIMNCWFSSGIHILSSKWQKIFPPTPFANLTSHGNTRFITESLTPA